MVPIIVCFLMRFFGSEIRYAQVRKFFVCFESVCIEFPFSIDFPFFLPVFSFAGDYFATFLMLF